MLEQLRQADPTDAARLDRAIQMQWRQSGSAAMDLLLKRGKQALERGDTVTALEHLTALIDHAPDFAEGWHLRASAWHKAAEPGLAIADLEQVLRLNPDHYEALFGLAVIMEQLERPQLAYRAYALVLTIHPQYHAAADAIARLEPLVEGLEL
ncbi:tetratricopeptide repeat protein [Thalassovita taeanensis]|nr:tetratricopeptide repeat protein [Thalassovita taeanensis]